MWPNHWEIISSQGTLAFKITTKHIFIFVQK